MTSIIRYVLAAALATTTLAVGEGGGVDDAEACGFKVVTIRRGARYREIKRTPTATAKARTPVATTSRPSQSEPRQPVDVGPKSDESRTLKQQMPPEPEPKPVAEEKAPPAAEPAPTPEPAPEEDKPAKAVKAPKNLTREVYFRPNSDELTSAGRQKLKANAAWLNANADVRVTIEGHADPTGAAELNMGLSERRANAVRDALVDQGVDGSRLEVQAFGSEKPKYKSNAKNRRVRMVVQ